MKQITFDLNCGETTCASSPGVFCQFSGSKNFGTVRLCTLFACASGEPQSLYPDSEGCIARCQLCLDKAH